MDPIRIISQTHLSRRRRYRARRLMLHPERDRRDEKAVLHARLLRALMTRMAQIQEQGGTAAKEAQDLKQQQLRAQADLQNFRKRVAKEKEDLRKFGVRPLLDALMPALDAFDHALAALDKGHDVEALAQGVEAIHQLFDKALADQGVEKIEPVGQEFDPNFHEALGVVATDEHAANTVIDVLQCGYVLHGRLLRPARVRIAQKP